MVYKLRSLEYRSFQTELDATPSLNQLLKLCTYILVMKSNAQNHDHVNHITSG